MGASTKIYTCGLEINRPVQGFWNLNFPPLRDRSFRVITNLWTEFFSTMYKICTRWEGLKKQWIIRNGRGSIYLRERDKLSAFWVE